MNEHRHEGIAGADASPTPKRRRLGCADTVLDVREASGIDSRLGGDLQSQGFIVMSSVLTAQELTYLRDESLHLFASLDSDTAVATQKVIEQGCVLDVLADCPMAETAAARTSQAAYLTARHKALTSKSSMKTSVDEYSTVLDHLLFHRLPAIAAQLMGAADNVIYFFNEHYVVKPPDTAVEFRWHRDDDEQLAMCVHRDSIQPYLSAWCALDDVTLDNGPLRFAPMEATRDIEDQDQEELEALAGPPLTVSAGTVVWFWSNVWHCSSANSSPNPRRAYYAQFSSECISASPKSDAPLSFAIRCQVGSSEGEN